MRFIEDLCSPALLYLLFLVVQLGLDASLGLWATLVIKVVFGIAMVVLLDMLCGVGLSLASWALVATPFLVTALATAIAMGTQFDAHVLGSLRERFMDKTAKASDLPAASNSIGNA